MIQTQQIANVHRTSAETVEKYLFPELQKSQGLNLLQKTEIKIQILWEQLLLVLLFQLSWPYLSLELFLLTNPTKIRQIRLALTSGKGMTMTLMKQPEENLEVIKNKVFLQLFISPSRSPHGFTIFQSKFRIDCLLILNPE